MNKHNQYYTESNGTRHNDYHRDQPNHETDAVNGYQFSIDEPGDDRADHHTVIDAPHPHFVGENDQWAEDSPDHDTYYEPYFAPAEDTTVRTHYQTNDEHFESDSERGFNMLYDSTLSNTDPSAGFFEDDHTHDSQDIIGQLTEQNKQPAFQVYADDLTDCPRKIGGIQIPKTISTICVLGFLAVLVTAILHSSKPDLSAYEIVQLESYDGLQKAPAIFNLTELEDCTSQSDCIKKSLSASKAELAEHTQLTKAIREIPAVNAAVKSESRPISLNSENTTAAIESRPEQLQVRAQWSNVRAAPDMSGAIITSLMKGTRITVISSTGNWYEIQTADDRQQRGFMHHSTVEAANF